jgi:hypothetical protein
MKTKNLLKLALIMVAIFTFAGANAQILTDYDNVAEDVYQTAGKTFRVYVEPDIVYSPGYDPATNAPLGAAARWTWTYPAGLSTGAPATATPVNQNWVEFTNPVVGGPFTLEVVESNTISGCADATAETRDIYVVAVPTATITTADPAQACDDQAAAAVAMTFTEAVPAGFAGYAFAINELVENIDPSDVVIGAALVDNDAFIDFPTSGKLNTGNDLTGGASPYGYTFNTSDLDVRNGLRTRYTYTLIKASDAPGAAADGVISAISEKSDYIGGTVLTHAFGAKTTFVAIVNPSPQTGPIFHIPNNFAY